MEIYPKLNMDTVNSGGKSMLEKMIMERSAQNHNEPSAPLYEPHLKDDYDGYLFPSYYAPDYATEQSVASHHNDIHNYSTTGINIMTNKDITRMQELNSLHADHEVRRVDLLKNGSGKYGIRLAKHNQGIFVLFVAPESPADLAEVHFGDQLLSINGRELAGKSAQDCMKTLKKLSSQVTLVLRDRPLFRRVNLHKDKDGSLGFRHKGNRIVSINKRSSASQNGLLIDHTIVEINGVCVVECSTNDIKLYLKSLQDGVTIAILPNQLYMSLIKNIARSLLKMNGRIHLH